MFLCKSISVPRSAAAPQSNRNGIADKPMRGRRRSACLILPGFLSGFRQYEEMAVNLGLLGHPEGKHDAGLKLPLWETCPYLAGEWHMYRRTGPVSPKPSVTIQGQLHHSVL